MLVVVKAQALILKATGESVKVDLARKCTLFAAKYAKPFSP